MTEAMTTIECAYGEAEKTQRRYARLAGFLFLWLIITGLAGMLTISHIGPQSVIRNPTDA